MAKYSVLLNERKGFKKWMLNCYFWFKAWKHASKRVRFPSKYNV